MHNVRRIAATLIGVLLLVGLVEGPASAGERQHLDRPSMHAVRDATGQRHEAAEHAKRRKMFYTTMGGFYGGGGSPVRIVIRHGALPHPLKAATIRRYIRRQGIEPSGPIKITGSTRKYRYRAFSARNMRFNLSIRTGYTRIEYDAHHVMPKKFEQKFARVGINIHRPQHVTWWYTPSHQRFAARYNRKWEKWFDENPRPTRKQVLKKAKKMRAKYAKYYAKPGPAGCKPDRCKERASDHRY